MLKLFTCGMRFNISLLKKNKVVYNKCINILLFNNRSFVKIHNGNIYVKRRVKCINVGTSFGSLVITRKIFAKPIAKLKLKL